MTRCVTTPGRRRYRPLARWVAAGSIMALVVTASPQARSADTQATAPIQVIIEKFKFIPPEITVPVGTTVEWVNHDDEPIRRRSTETVQIEGARQGRHISMTFEEPGQYPYYCLIHPHMTGVVIVGEGSRQLR